MASNKEMNQDRLSQQSGSPRRAMGEQEFLRCGLPETSILALGQTKERENYDYSESDVEPMTSLPDKSHNYNTRSKSNVKYNYKSQAEQARKPCSSGNTMNSGVANDDGAEIRYIYTSVCICVCVAFSLSVLSV